MFQTKEEGMKKLKDVIEDIKTCMFTTTDDNCNVFSRPMFTVKIDNEYCLWFFSKDTDIKAGEMNPDKQVTLVFAHPGKNAYMNVYGTCSSVWDRNKMKELWNPALKAWFRNGTEDPELSLIKVCINEALYWDNSTNEMISVYKSENEQEYQNQQESSLLTSCW